MLVREVRYGSFRRDVSLPRGITADQVSASDDRGVVTVRMAGISPKPEAVRVPITNGTSEQAEQAA